MTELRPSELELMRMHVEALFTHDDRSRIEAVNEPEGALASRFFLGRTRAGNILRCRTDMPDALVMELERLSNGEPETNEPSRMPVRR